MLASRAAAAPSHSAFSRSSAPSRPRYAASAASTRIASRPSRSRMAAASTKVAFMAELPLHAGASRSAPAFLPRIEIVDFTSQVSLSRRKPIPTGKQSRMCDGSLLNRVAERWDPSAL